MTFRMRWPTHQSTILQRFGENPDIYRKFGLPGHEGVDFVAPRGTQVYAVADGFVSDVRLDGFADPMLKPYGNQLRIQHVDGYETVYAHLSQTSVLRGQLVKAGQPVGLTGDTGHVTGAHLHFGLKHHRATVNGETPYPYDLVDPEPFFLKGEDGGPDPLQPLEPSVQVIVDTREGRRLDVVILPRPGAQVIASVARGGQLDAFEDAGAVRRKVGQPDQWLWVGTPDGQVGWAPAWEVRLPDAELSPARDPDSVVVVIVESPEGDLRLRDGPGRGFREIARLPDGMALRALENLDVVETKVGQREAWLWVLTPTGAVGYCAARYLKLLPFGDKPVIPEPTVGEPTKYVVVDSPDSGLRLRAGPGTDYEKVWWMAHKMVLLSLEDPEETGRKLGRQGEWIHVRTPAHYEGYAAAWFLRRPDKPDERVLAEREDLPTGVSPHLFGIHAVSIADDPYSRDRIRGLYEGTGKKGWVFFTEMCGRHPHTIQLVPEIRQRLWNWVDNGYGVIVRLNHGYEPGGTLPESRYYDDYAAAAARWVEVYLHDKSRSPSDYTWTLQIGNEQNNPREHPGGFEHPVEHITAERYADAFNRTYTAIKRMLPNAVICPGAVDPYNYMPMHRLGGQRWRPLDYYQTMLSLIDELDGIILHAYTHGPNLERVTHLKRFGEGTGPLWDHYYDFQVYRVFMERIPARWHEVPVYITETNHIHRPAGEHDQGWINENVGWVQAVYDEINRWNQMPYAQQIRCALLYRWMGDAWSIEGKDGILQDFQQALQLDYRWRDQPEEIAFGYGLGRDRGGGVRFHRLEERFLVYPDDFTQIWGIGERTQVALRAAGIMIFEQLMDLRPQELEMILSETGLRAAHIDSWPEQAVLASQGRWDELAARRQHLA